MNQARVLRIGGLTAAGLLIVLLTAVSVLYLVQRDRVLPNVTLGGAEVAGLTQAQVRDAVSRLASTRADADIVFTFDGDEYPLAPDTIGYGVEVDATVDAALGVGRQGLPGEVVSRVRALWQPHHIQLVQRWDDQLLADWVSDLAASIDREQSPGRLEVDPETLELTVEAPHGSAHLVRDEALDLARRMVAAAPRSTAELPVETTPAMVAEEDLTNAAQLARAAIAAPIELEHDDGTWTLTPSDIARLIGLERTTIGERQTVELVVTPGRLDLVADRSLRDSLARDPTDATYDNDREPPVTLDAQGSVTFEPVETTIGIAPSTTGTRFDPRLTAAQITDMIHQGVRRAQMRLETIEPELSTARATDLRPTHLLGTFTTYYQPGQARVHNIQLLADTVDGTVVLPGEQFSINGISGRRTCESGYRPAGTIVRGELVDTCGGGTSQFGTTTFNAAFFSGVQLDQWRAHSWYISRYPMGREATLNYPELDVRFTNTTTGALLVRTSHTGTSVTVSIYGQPIARQVTAVLGNPTNPRSPTTQVRETSELYVGQERVVQSAGSGGFTVRVLREIELLNGETVTETIDTVYVPQNRIVERGTRPRPSNDDGDGDGD